MKNNDPFITNSEYYKLIQCMRQTFSRSEYAKSIKKDYLSDKKGKRGGMLTKCGHCGKSFQPKQVELHHLDPVIPTDKHYYELSLEEIWERLWCDRDRAVMLCKSCHQIETDKQEEERDGD